MKKTYVLTVSQVFPATHPRKGEPTNFIDQIREGIKIHTIRNNVELWTKRAVEINAGRAVLSVRVWSGKPYRSSQVEVFDFTSIGIQIIELTMLGFFIDTIESDVSTRVLAAFDGLSFKDFVEWFKDAWKPNEPKVIIHFTDFRY